MKQTVELVAVSREVSKESTHEEIRHDQLLIAGKAAGICYMPDDYFSKAINDDEKSIKRSLRNADSGHYSVFEHGHATFVINTSKMMAMILNSLNLYSTSEKSARYTAMNPETELEKQMYTKWKDIYVKLISPFYDTKLSSKEIEKLAMENARYMISVFTPTILEYTVPYGRMILTCGWLYSLSDTINIYVNKCPGIFPNISKYYFFYNRVAKECVELADEISKVLGITKDDHILEDHKRIGISFFRTFGILYKTYMNTEDSVSNLKKTNSSFDKEEYFGDVYISKYKASFAELAQAERHRTLHYTMELPDKLIPYIPKIIRGTSYEMDWINDFNELIANKIVPQSTLLDIEEEGRFPDFVLKCKERLCSRAQLEIMEITRDQVEKFAYHMGHLSFENRYMLEDMIIRPKDSKDDIIIKARCAFQGYTCKEPCKIVNEKINYYRNA